MRPEYDFSNGVRGKHAAGLKNGHTTIITKSDGSTLTVDSQPVFLESDVRQYFLDNESVNQALRGIHTKRCLLSTKRAVFRLI